MEATRDSSPAAKRPGLAYVPNKTLGRSGYIISPADRLAERVGHLDALAKLVADTDDDGEPHLLKLNDAIVHEVLSLVADLAHEVHELHEQLLLEKVADAEQRLATAGVPHG